MTGFGDTSTVKELSLPTSWLGRRFGDAGRDGGREEDSQDDRLVVEGSTRSGFGDVGREGGREADSHDDRLVLKGSYSSGFIILSPPVDKRFLLAVTSSPTEVAGRSSGTFSHLDSSHDRGRSIIDPVLRRLLPLTGGLDFSFGSTGSPFCRRLGGRRVSDALSVLVRVVLVLGLLVRAVLVVNFLVREGFLVGVEDVEDERPVMEKDVSSSKSLSKERSKVETESLMADCCPW